VQRGDIELRGSGSELLGELKDDKTKMGHHRSLSETARSLTAAVARPTVVFVVLLGCQRPQAAAPASGKDGGLMGIVTEGGCYVATPVPNAPCTNSAGSAAGTMTPDDTCVHFRVEGVRSTQPTSPPLMIRVTSPSMTFNPSAKELPSKLGETAVPIEFDTVIDAQVTGSSVYKIFLLARAGTGQFSGVIQDPCRRR